jgi:hypothetical protein
VHQDRQASVGLLTGATQLRLRFKKDDSNDMHPDYLRSYSDNADASIQTQLIIDVYAP